MKKKDITASFISLGCFKNSVDTEVLGGLLEKKGIRLVSPYETSDWIVINTCGFIRDAKEESIDEILAALEKKEKGEIAHVAVFGCLTQRYHQDLRKNFQNADIIWGVNDLTELADIIASGKNGEYQNQNLFLYDHNYKRIITTTPNTTFIKISEGCNMVCSFCAIPQIRGPYRSRTIESIVTEAQKYREMGFEELNLISQNSTCFGKDRSSRPELPDLLKAVASLGFQCVRVLYLMPEEVTNDILQGFDQPSVIPYFDLPFQHVAANVLKRMNRGGGRARNMEMINTIRKRFPAAVIRSSFIVGFPGESEADFLELCQFAEETNIERFGVFAYSDEENTPAFKLEDKIEEEVLLTRRETLMDISDANIRKYNRSLLNSTQYFLPMGPCPWDSGATVGRILSQAPETDGLTQVNTLFDDEFHGFSIRVNRFKDEMLYGVKL